jgi:hypothetical protein
MREFAHPPHPEDGSSTMSTNYCATTAHHHARRAIGISIVVLTVLTTLAGCSADTTGKAPSAASATPEYFPYAGPHGPLWPAPKRD